MAKLPTDIPDLVEAFGPTLGRVPPGGWADTREDDKLVKTHCCFCGQQCGIQLRVRSNKIVGFEPWEDFPFNRGKLCPKGIKRYMQDEHPDRLKSPLERVDGLGFVPVGWDAALDRVVERNQPHSGEVRQGFIRRPDRCFDDQREGLPHGQVRSCRSADCKYRL